MTENKPGKDVSKIRLLIMDVDGVLSDGRIIYGADGSEYKAFDVKDGAGLKYWARAGNISAIITGRTSPLVERRANELDINILKMNQKDKLPAFEEILEKLQVAANEVAYVGDDLPDIPPMVKSGVSFAVSDAEPEVREIADFVTENNGGRGAVREVIRFILQASGKWDGIMARYIKD